MLLGEGVATVSVDQRGDIVPRAPLTDDEFMAAFEGGTLRAWGHDCKIRVIYLLLQRRGRTGQSASAIIETLAAAEGVDAHLTVNYFWVQMVTYHMAVVAKSASASSSADANEGDGRAKCGLTFNEFMAQPRCQALREQLLYQKYYSRGVIDRAAIEFVLPDLKQLPTLV